MNRQRSGFGLYAAFMVIIVLAMFYITGKISAGSSPSQQKFETAVKDGKVTSAQIVQNKEVPTGSVVVQERYASAEKNAVVLRDAVSSEAPLLQRYVIRRVLEQLAGKRKDLTREHLESVRELFEKQVGKSVCLPYGITAVRGYETLRLEKQGVHLKEERKRKSGEEVPIPVPAGWEEEKSLAFAENPVTIVKKTSVFPERIEEKKYTKCFDCDKIKDGLVLRTRRSGDYLRVTAKGGKKKLKDYMIDAKIPKEERDSILLLADGPEIWWVVGYRRGESGRVGEDTKAVLQIQIGVGKEENR